MRRVIHPIAAALVICLSLTTAAEADVIKQETSNQFASILFFADMGQSFVAVDDRLRAIEVHYSDSNPGDGVANITIDVLTGAGFGGALIASATRDLSGKSGWQRFDFPNTPLTPGAVYTFRVSATNLRGAVTFFQHSNSPGVPIDPAHPGYLGGVMYADGDVLAVADLRFRVYGATAYRLTWRHQTSGTLSSWTMVDRALETGNGLTPSVVADTNWQIVGSGDFNNDGHADLFWQHRVSRLMTVWLMNGDTFIGAGLLSHNTVSDTNWSITAIADMDKDGDPDLVWRHATEGWLGVWIMNGLNFVEGKQLTPNRVADSAWQIVGAADFDNDGDTDFLWQNSKIGQITVWRMDGTTFVGSGVLSNNLVSDLNWKIVAVADADGNGSPDIIWRHQVTGALVVWYQNGFTFMGAQALSPSAVTDTDWKIVAVR